MEASGPAPVHGQSSGGQLRTADAADQITALYREHALRLTRVALLLVGDLATAEDVVAEAFCGLYSR